MSMSRRNLRHRPIIRVFVSSTFSDLVFERNALQQRVWPVLEQLCLKHGFQFHAIDLRWGVSTEAGLDHRTMRICFEELRRSQGISPEPNFLILLGNRYGWRPMPEEISHEEFDRLVAAAKSGGDGRQPLAGTHGKSAEDVLNEWYRCDKNVLVPTAPGAVHDHAPLNYILQPRTQHLNDGRDFTRTTEPRPADTQDWLDVQQVLWSIINAAFAVTDAVSAESGTMFEQRFDDIDWPRHIAEVHAREHPKRAVPQIVRFQGSATEQEIWCGTLSEHNAREHVLAFVREIDNLLTAPRLTGLKNFVDLDPAGQIDPVAQQALNRLKQALRDRLGKNYVETTTAQLIAAVDENKRPIIDQDQQPTISITTSHIEPFWKSVLDKLTPLVQKQIHDYWRQTNSPHTESRQPAATEQRAARELEIERDEHLRFGRERGPKEAFVGRKDQLQRIVDYANGDSSKPLVIHGASGCGKTALLARAVEDIPAAKQPIVRFIGVTPRSSDLRSLLRSLCQEFRQQNPIEAPLPSDIRELIDEFPRHLQAATAEQPVILFLDALDQLAESDNGRQLFWIPFGQLPSHVKIVVSCLSDRDEKDPVAQPFIALQRRKLPAENMISLDALSQDEAQTLLFERWLPAVGRTVAKAQRHLIEQRLESEACRQPLYLKLLFEEVKLWRSCDEPTEPGDGVPALLEQLFDRLSQPEHHGLSLVKFVLGYIAAARRGLSETEILEVLFADLEYKQQLEKASQRNNHTLPTDPPRIPIAIWSRLRSDLAPYLAERASPGGNVLSFYHRQVAEWVKASFLDEVQWMPHEQLAEYFEKQDYFLETLEAQFARAKRLPATVRPANVRKVDELPWQLRKAIEYARIDSAVRRNDAKLLANTLCDIELLNAKAEARLIDDLNLDYRAGESALQSYLAQAPNSDNDLLAQMRIIGAVRDHLSLITPFYRSHPTELLSQLLFAASTSEPVCGDVHPDGPLVTATDRILHVHQRCSSGWTAQPIAAFDLEPGAIVDLRLHAGKDWVAIIRVDGTLSIFSLSLGDYLLHLRLWERPLAVGWCEDTLHIITDRDGYGRFTLLPANVAATEEIPTRGSNASANTHLVRSWCKVAVLRIPSLILAWLRRR